jgi:hypothetical protein
MEVNEDSGYRLTPTNAHAVDLEMGYSPRWNILSRSLMET